MPKAILNTPRFLSEVIAVEKEDVANSLSEDLIKSFMNPKMSNSEIEAQIELLQ